MGTSRGYVSRNLHDQEAVTAFKNRNSIFFVKVTIYEKIITFEIHTASEFALEVIDPDAINPTADAEVEELLYKSEAV